MNNTAPCCCPVLIACCLLPTPLPACGILVPRVDSLSKQDNEGFAVLRETLSCKRHGSSGVRACNQILIPGEVRRVPLEGRVVRKDQEGQKS